MEVTGRPKKIIVDDVDKRIKQKEDEVINPNLIHLRESQETLEKIKEKKNNVPKCPNCGSSSIEKITGLNRAFSIGLFGLASSRIGKTMQCKNCGYKW